MVCLPSSDHVVLLHGINRSSRMLRKLEKYLQVHGYCTHNLNYPSTRYPIAKLAEDIFTRIQSITHNQNVKVHFVGHSLGAIIIRHILKNNVIENLGRVVMITPPNNGSEVADFFARFAFYRKIFGPAGMELCTHNKVFFTELGSPNYEVGVIAGDRSRDWFYSRFLLAHPNDGKVNVASTHLKGIKDHIILPVAHSKSVSETSVLQQTVFFLAHGYFQHSA